MKIHFRRVACNSSSLLTLTQVVSKKKYGTKPENIRVLYAEKFWPHTKRDYLFT